MSCGPHQSLCPIKFATLKKQTAIETTCICTSENTGYFIVFK